MTENNHRPLLFFPTKIPATRNRPQGFGRDTLNKPTPQQQINRLSPKFAQLQSAFINIQQSADYTDPEYVLVIELIKPIEDFVNAVNRIDGLEWLCEIDIDDIVPDEYFYDTSNQGRNLKGRLYFTSTNQTALNNILSLWDNYRQNPTESFPRNYGKFKTMFECLYDIRKWNIQDRLNETGIIESWQLDLQDEYLAQQPKRFEIELWFRQNSDTRQQNTTQIRELISNLGGSIISETVIEEIAYHALLAELPANQIQTFMTNEQYQNVQLFKCESVMFFRSVGQIVGDIDPQDETEELNNTDFQPTNEQEPIVALFDGMPLSNHQLLSGRLTVDDPDNFEQDYPAINRKHGTAMASLIIHGDLNEQNQPLSRKIYVRPIMKPVQIENNRYAEVISEDYLLIDLIHRAVKRLFDGENQEPAVAPQIKIINLSIGDKNRVFIHSLSPLAKLLDWLSEKYKVLFIVSAGNYEEDIELTQAVNSLNDNDREKLVIQSVYQNSRHHRLLSPAETINSITVGAVHSDNAQIQVLGNRINPFVHILPSTISRLGYGYRKSIKPDIIFSGGRQLYNKPFSDNDNKISISGVITAPGNKTAASNNANATAYTRGTSNATALMSHYASICYDNLQQILQEQTEDLSAYEIPLLKAMLVHSSSWHDIEEHIENALGKKIDFIRRWAGYGIADIERVLNCTAQRATVLGFGSLTDGQAHIFKLPLPPSLSPNTEKRRLTITLAYLSPIAPKTQKYRIAKLWFEAKDSDKPDTNKPTIADDRQECCGGQNGFQFVQNGTVQHEIFEGANAIPFMDGDSIAIKVNCRKEVGEIEQPIAYGLIVSLEVSENVDIAIYDEIRTRIMQPVLIQPNLFE
ncbi:MAG: S8 family peptidase [Neisseriaceae bacterium]|nr:S8 family peptidase [Neisseriaceae bacterium]